MHSRGEGLRVDISITANVTGMLEIARSLVLLSAGLSLLPGCAPRAQGVQVRDAVIREGLPGVPDGVLYLTVVNGSQTPVKLLGGETTIARAVVPMLGGHGPGDDRSGAGHAITVHGGGKLTFSPGGQHMMVVGLKHSPKVDETVEVTLKFEPGGDLTLKVPVKGY